MRRALRQESKSARSKGVVFAVDGELQCAFEEIDETLCRRGPECASGCKLRGHLGEAGAQLRRNVDHKLHAFRAGQRRANEGVCKR